MTTADRIADLETADEAYREAAAAVEEVGEDRLRTVADAHQRFTGLLDRYADSATGSGDFGAYVEFQDRIETLVEGLPDDLPAYGAFERAGEALEKRRLSEADLERAREELAPAADAAARLEEREAARGRYRDARRAVRERRREIADRIVDLESLLDFEDADFDASVDDLRGPIAAYDDAVGDAFTTFRREAPAREVIAFLDATEAYPLVDFRPPPDDLREYLATTPAGTESIPTLLEYADYSRSKLDHYVDDPREFRMRVGANQAYLVRLDAEPLRIGWPPPSADELRWRARELVAVVDRFAPDDVVAALHRVRRLAHDPEYGRLRGAARANHELTAEERDRLESGAVERDLAELREERDRLDEALAAHPER